MRIRKTVQVLLQFKMLKEKWKRAWAWINQVEHYTPDVFVKSQWQRGETSTLYLLYRWTVAAFFMCGIVASWLDLGRNSRRTVHHFAKWPVYLTNWGFSLCTLQAVIAAAYVTQHYVRVRRAYPNKLEIKKMKISYKFYWILHSITAICALIITTVYWSAVYDPKNDGLDVVNVVVHLCNSVLMVLDLWIVAHPFKLLHSYYALILASVYITFNYTYFVLGGTDRKGHVYIYKIMDWREPLSALLAFAGIIVVGAVITVLLWTMSLLKRRLANLFHHKTAPKPTTTTANRGARIV